MQTLDKRVRVARSWLPNLEAIISACFVPAFDKRAGPHHLLLLTKWEAFQNKDWQLTWKMS